MFNISFNKIIEKFKPNFSRPIKLQLNHDAQAKMIDFSVVKAAITSNDLNTLFSIYQKILNCDLNLSGALENRRDALLSLGFKIEALNKEQKIIDKILDNFDINSLIRAITNDMYYGISLQNIVYEVKNNLVIPTSYNTLLPTLLNEEIKDNENNLYFKLKDNKKLYINSINSNRLLIHKHCIDNSSLQNSSIAYKLLFSLILKHTIQTLNLEYFDKAAIPPLIIKVQDLNDSKAADGLFAQMMELKSTSVGMFTKEMDIDTLKFNSKVDFLKSIEYFDKKTNEFILGGNLNSSSEGVGSQALGKVHEERLMEKIRSDAKLLNKTISSFFNEILALNLNSFTPVTFSFLVPQKKNEEELKTKSEYILNLSNSGYQIPCENIENIFNIKGVSFKQTNQVNKSKEKANNKIEFNKQKELNKEVQEDFKKEVNSENEEESTKVLEDEVLEYLNTILQKCNSYEQLEENIIKEFNYLDLKKLQDLLLKDNIKEAINGSLNVGNDKE